MLVLSQYQPKSSIYFVFAQVILILSKTTDVTDFNQICIHGSPMDTDHFPKFLVHYCPELPAIARKCAQISKLQTIITPKVFDIELRYFNHWLYT